jgi:hypothetical protein
MVPSLIFGAGCLCPVLAFLLDSPGNPEFQFVGLLMAGFTACVSASWMKKADKPATKTLLSFAAAFAYFCEVVILVCVSIVATGMPTQS